MGYKVVCLDCRKAFSQGTDFENFRESVCPDCGKKMVFLNQKFKPPKKTNKEKWETVTFLIEHGFYYQHIYEKIEMKNGTILHQNHVAYPENLRDANDFVVKYKAQGRTK